MNPVIDTEIIPLEIRNSLREFREEVASVLKDSLNRVVLFGSYSRGDYEPDSDIDLLILLNRPIDKGTESIISDIAAKFLIEKNILLSVLIYDVSFYDEWKTTMDLFIFIENEGKVI